MTKMIPDTGSTRRVILGNEAIARGALEAGAQVCVGYPGTPSSEIIDTLAQVAKECDIYVEWSINEKVATETAAAGSFAGLRSMVTMKVAGLYVAMDFLAHLAYNDTGAGGLVVVVCDDPVGRSSTDECDSRMAAKWMKVPLLEPATVDEAKELTKWCFELSEQVRHYCLLRSVTRLSHSKGIVNLGPLPTARRVARFDTSKVFISMPAAELHARTLEKMKRIQELYDSSQFNWYEGPDDPEMILVACGSGYLCSKEALSILKLNNRVGILKISTLWPLPIKFISKHTAKVEKILVVEEIEPFIEQNIKANSQEIGLDYSVQAVLGQGSGHIREGWERSVDEVLIAVLKILGLRQKVSNTSYDQEAKKVVDEGLLVSRDLTYCPGCPHRASFWAIKNALKLNDQDGFICNDIGCYGMESFTGGTQMTRTHYEMGGGIGIANGLGKLRRFGFKQDVIAVCGDSTFFHACIPALIDAKANSSSVLFIILDNSVTGMTGFQPHPGTKNNAMGEAKPVVSIESIVRAIGVPVEVTDAFDVSGTTEKILRLIDQEGVRVLISRRMCELQRVRDETSKPYKVRVDVSKCRGADCSCANYCIRVFKCPGLNRDVVSDKVAIDEAMCSGCGVCVDICSHLAIVREATIRESVS